jgi:hypothetical protein
MSSIESGNKKHWVDPVLLMQDISKTESGSPWGGTPEGSWYSS